MLQYNLTSSSKSQYNIVLQYKFSPQAFFSAIQYCVLQYNASTTSPSHVTIQCLSCNTISLPFFFSALSLAIQLQGLQYKFFFSSQYNRFCSNFFFFNFFFHYNFFSSYFHCRHKNLYTFFFSNTPNKFIKIYFHSFFFNFTHCKTLRKIFLLINFFFLLSYWKITKKNTYIHFFFFTLFPATGKTPKIYTCIYIYIYFTFSATGDTKKKY